MGWNKIRILASVFDRMFVNPKKNEKIAKKVEKGC